MAEFERTNWGWQLQQGLRQFGEWLESLDGSAPRRQSSEWTWPDWIPQLLMVLGILIIAILLALLGYQSWLAWRSRQWSRTQPIAQSSERITEQLSVAGWLQRAQQLQQQGQYPEACRCLYLALIQRLHDLNIAPHQVSRTDGEYLNIVQTSPQFGSCQVVVNTHEHLCFGPAVLSSDPEISATAYQDCQQALQQADILPTQVSEGSL